MLRTVAHRRDSPQLRALLIKKVQRRGVQFEELRHLAQGTMQRIAEVERFRQGLGDRIQHQKFALAPHFEFKIGYRTMLLEQLLQSISVRLVGIESARNVDRHQFFARFIAGHAEKRLVEIEEASLRRGNKHALLYARNEGTVFLLRA